MNNRRKIILALGASALAAPFELFAQQPGKIPRVGFLANGFRAELSDPSSLWSGFLEGLRELGYVEGKNIVVEWRFAEGKLERQTPLIAELVQLKVDVIVVTGTQGTQAASRATKTIPIVIGNITDPVGLGLVASLARPGGNITGLCNMAEDLSPKYVELLKAFVPGISRVAFLNNPANSVHPRIFKGIQSTAAAHGIKVLQVDAKSAPDLEPAFAAMKRERIQGVIVGADGFFTGSRRRLAELAGTHRIAMIGPSSNFTEAGALMSYGQNSRDSLRRAATFVDKILKGANPALLPIEQSTTLELVVNRKTATAFGLKIPQEIVLRADKVIE
jgi:putative ABC transport system substrate-binding protein